VECVSRLSDALTALSSETPSLVLLDLNLPDSRGAETFRKVMEKAPSVPVVVLSDRTMRYWPARPSTTEYRITS
jgi:DNA-binding response OmpR family regulator